LVGVVVGVALGWFLNERSRISQAREARKARLHALRVEVEQCGDSMRGYLQANVAAPLYRLPTWAGTQALGYVAMDGSLDEGQVHALLLYYTKIEEVNRGLDRAGEAHAGNDQVQLAMEYNRLCLKIPEILNSEEASIASLQARVERAIKEAIERS
jgi:hypothetical protein